MANTTSRRNFLCTVPAAAAAGLALSNAVTALAHAETSAGADVAAAAVPFQYLSANTLESDVKAIEAAPGNKNLFGAKRLPVNIVMTSEQHTSAKEFEWHEGRDHIVQILEGSTVYEVGGKPTAGHVNKGPGEWLSPSAEETKSFTMGKGDMLVLPRGTLHKRSTEGSVTFLLISTPGVVQG
jgi:mannose-6-phosphate isomerase-like protein (cupin superfamily)